MDSSRPWLTLLRLSGGRSISESIEPRCCNGMSLPKEYVTGGSRLSLPWETGAKGARLEGTESRGKGAMEFALSRSALKSRAVACSGKTTCGTLFTESPESLLAERACSRMCWSRSSKLAKPYM